MKVTLLPDRFDLVCEAPEDWNSLVVHCENCGSLHRYGPETSAARRAKADYGKGDGDFLAVSAPRCPRCRPSASDGGEFIGRFPGTTRAVTGAGAN
jgi:hypothetical protein